MGMLGQTIQTRRMTNVQLFGALVVQREAKSTTLGFLARTRRTQAKKTTRPKASRPFVGCGEQDLKCDLSRYGPRVYVRQHAVFGL